ncbi:inner membrane protease subunit 1 [Monoraphidium neglectum]|uniref:Inner membrane protease subunit 1 n=1 Tax=Monoraphidium neglectum TaxID=145388 RepID=A0A0D2NA79_9CHLO|nr:inner membrane protease subunit 1 [Monoraphidium neglectum]KIZ02486.1 inner membrane protease subunit 1 [Monoraphidium neglectum]|eukprot:XP_013901505.1 inner membrane protease subunit 1 [Monoraphidium neglectum]
MFPTFNGRGWNVVVAEALPGVHDRVEVGDVVICIRPVNARESVIKRVTAVEGQTVSLYSRGSTAPTRLQVPTGHIWLQGDNLIMSRDSREYGPVPLALVRGRVICQLLPDFKWVQSRLPGQA